VLSLSVSRAFEYRLWKRYALLLFLLITRFPLNLNIPSREFLFDPMSALGYMAILLMLFCCLSFLTYNQFDYELYIGCYLDFLYSLHSARS